MKDEEVMNVLCRIGIHRWKLHYKWKSCDETPRKLSDGRVITQVSGYVVSPRCRCCGKRKPY